MNRIVMMLTACLAVGAEAAPVEFSLGRTPDGVDLTVRRGGDSPFTFIDFAPKPGQTERRVNGMELSEIRLKAWADRLMMQGSWGLKPLADDISVAYVAIAEPYTRRGVVCAYLTNLKASGAISIAAGRDGSIVLKPILEYGRMLVRPGSLQVKDTLVVGAFDDCRLGLERYADEIAKRFSIKLPRNRSGATTWCFDRYGYSDRSEIARGCGAGTPDSARRYVEAAEKLLVPYGFDFYQLDDQWQSGTEKINGPARDFVHPDPGGPFPQGFGETVKMLNSKGIAAGLWFLPSGGQEREKGWSAGDIFVKTPEGKTLSSRWRGDAIDFSKKGGVDYLAGLVRLFTYDWGFRYLKCDGIGAAMAGRLFSGGDWRDVEFEKAVFADPTTSNVENYRRSIETIRANAAPGTFILGCNLADVRPIAPSYGLFDGMRIGGDNGPIDMFPKRYLEGQIKGTRRYFFNARVWWNDPDSVYVRAAVPYERARSTAGWMWLTDSLYECGDWLPDLPPDRVELLQKTIGHHGSKQVRPIDYFEHDLANGWIAEFKDGSRAIGVFNWSTNETLSVDYPFDYAGLDGAKTYEARDFWTGRDAGRLSGRIRLELKPDDSRILLLK